MLFLGIDGGGTATRAAIATREGHVVALGIGRGSNYQSVGVQQARESIDEAVADAFEQAARARRMCDAAFLGMAGVVSSTDRSTMLDIVAGLGLAGTITVDHDIRTALAGGLAGKEGIALIAGTGSSCYGRRDDGRDHRAGGWGALLDDAGGGYWIGLEGLKGIVRSVDGRGQQSSLLPLLSDALRLASLDDLLRRSGIQGLDKETVAALAPIVMEAAREGDELARVIMRNGARELSLMIAAVHWRLWKEGESTPRVVGVGGLLENQAYRDMVEPHPLRPILPPVLGALLLAMESVGARFDEDVVATMQRTFANNDNR